MKDIITIIIRLTVSCLLAATVMGLCFVFTSNAKKHNEYVKEQRVVYHLLGYEAGKIPAGMKMHEIYRYVLSGDGAQSIGYLVPVGAEDKPEHMFFNIDLNGQLIDSRKVQISEKDIIEDDQRNARIQETVGAAKKATYADQTIVVTNEGKRSAYLLKGKFQGFKTFINVMLAVDPQFAIIGLEILEHEEDPGLGAEIEQKYFKNQFRGKPLDAIRNIDVAKEPIPAEYLEALNDRMGESEIQKLEDQYKDKKIYALTGATISSRSVSNGVRGIVTKFVYRIDVLDKVLKEQNAAVPF